MQVNLPNSRKQQGPRNGTATTTLYRKTSTGSYKQSGYSSDGKATNANQSKTAAQRSQTTTASVGAIPRFIAEDIFDQRPYSDLQQKLERREKNTKSLEKDLQHRDKLLKQKEI